jgi:hypothetical protein
MPRKTIPQCTNGEIRGFLIAGTIIASVIGAVSFSGTPQSSAWLFWGAWCVRVYVVIWLVRLWFEALRELHLRRRDSSREPQ